jgi:hypothetical protein
MLRQEWGQWPAASRRGVAFVCDESCVLGTPTGLDRPTSCPQALCTPTCAALHDPIADSTDDRPRTAHGQPAALAYPVSSSLQPERHRFAPRQNRPDARGSSGTLKWDQFRGRLRVLGVNNHMTTTRSTNTNTVSEHARGYSR